MTVCQIVRGGLVGRNLESCVFSWSNSPSISSLWLELATGSVSERVLTMCWFSFLKSPSSTHTFFLYARASWHPRAPTFIWWSFSFSSRISRGAFIKSLILGATLDYRVTSRNLREINQSRFLPGCLPKLIGYIWPARLWRDHNAKKPWESRGPLSLLELPFSRTVFPWQTSRLPFVNLYEVVVDNNGTNYFTIEVSQDILNDSLAARLFTNAFTSHLEEWRLQT